MYYVAVVELISLKKNTIMIYTVVVHISDVSELTEKYVIKFQ